MFASAPLLFLDFVFVNFSSWFFPSVLLTLFPFSSLSWNACRRLISSNTIPGTSLLTISWRGRSGLICKSGLVLWTSTSQTGQWNDVWRYFTMQLRQNECRHSIIVVASTKYPPHNTHMMCGLSCWRGILSNDILKIIRNSYIWTVSFPSSSKDSSGCDNEFMRHVTARPNLSRSLPLFWL